MRNLEQIGNWIVGLAEITPPIPHPYRSWLCECLEWNFSWHFQDWIWVLWKQCCGIVGLPRPSGELHQRLYLIGQGLCLGATDAVPFRFVFDLFCFVYGFMSATATWALCLSVCVRETHFYVCPSRVCECLTPTIWHYFTIGGKGTCFLFTPVKVYLYHNLKILCYK